MFLDADVFLSYMVQYIVEKQILTVLFAIVTASSFFGKCIGL